MAHRPQARAYDSAGDRGEPDRYHDSSVGSPRPSTRAYTSTQARGNSRVHQGDILRGNTIHNHYHLSSHEHGPTATNSRDDRGDVRPATPKGRLSKEERAAIEREAFEAQAREELKKQEKIRAQTYELLVASLRFLRMSARLLNVEQAASETCQWIFQHDIYCRWLDDAQLSDHHGFLWIKGKPGSGKSTIMKLLHDSTISRSRRQITISYFFNGRASGDLEKSSLGLFRYLVSQLLEFVPSTRELFLNRFESKVFNGIVDEWTATELKVFLSDLLCATERPPVNIFIDALDEGHIDDVRQLVAFLEQLTVRAIAKNSSCLRICLSSRHYPHITIRKGLPLMLDDEDDHNQDIRTFVRTTLEPEAETLLDEICERAAGIFLWVILVVPRLNAKMDEGTDLNTARELLHTLPTDLDALFTGILDRDAEDIDECVELLQWVLFAQAALSPLNLHQALQFSSGNTSVSGCHQPNKEQLRRYFLHRSRGLLEITRDLCPVVQFIHETVRTFLLTPHGLPRIRPVLTGRIASMSHESLKEFCVAFFISHQGYYEELIPRLYSELSSDDGDESDTDDDGLGSDGLSLVTAKGSKSASQPVDLYKYAVQFIFRHANLARLDGTSQQGSLKILEERKLLTVLCHCFLLYKSIAKCSSELFVIRVREACSTLDRFSEEKLVQLVKCMVGTQNRAMLFSSAVTIACTLHNTDIARLVVEGGLRKNYELVAEIKKYSSFSPALLTHLLQETIHSASVDEVKVLLELGVRIDTVASDPNGLGTALQAAVYWERKDIFDLLIRYGADVNQQAGVYGTALNVAAHQGKIDMATALLGIGAFINVEVGLYGTALQAATYGCQKQMVEFLCKAGSDVNITTSTYGSALHAAAYRGHHELIDFLIEAGANVNIQAGTYGTALQAAAWSPDATVETIDLLLGHGAFIDTRAGVHGSALHAAAVRASFETMLDDPAALEHDRRNCHAADRGACKIAVVETLIRRGAIITPDDWQEPGLIQAYQELYDFATKNQNDQLIDLLLNATIEDEHTDGKAVRALLGAALFGNPRQIGMLLRYGARIPSEGIDLHSRDWERWVWDRFMDMELRQSFTSRFDWINVHNDGYCRGEEISSSSWFIDDFVYNFE